MTQATKRPGRPTKAVEPGKRASLGLKVNAEIKQRLEAEAERNGRTQSQEAEARLERSFDRDDLLSDALSAAFGDQLAGLLLMLGRAMNDSGRMSAFASKRTVEASQSWLDDPWAYDQAVRAAEQILSALRPAGELLLPTVSVAASNVESANEIVEITMQTMGIGFANAVIRDAQGDGPTEEGRRFGERMRKLIGPLNERLKDWEARNAR